MGIYGDTTANSGEDNMAFDPINTQEELDKVIQSRIERERKAIESRYSDYDALKLQVADLTQKLKDEQTKHSDTVKQITDLQNAVKGYELEVLKTNIAQETGIPFALRGRLQGNTEEEIRKDAETLVGLIGQKDTKPATPPAPAPKLNETVGTPDPFMEMAKKLGG